MPSPRPQQLTTTTPPFASTADAPDAPTLPTVGRESAPPARILVVAAAGVTHVSLAGALLLALACAAAVVSGFSDGGYAAALTGRANQPGRARRRLAGLSVLAGRRAALVTRR
jgi:hypothetical protein